jgi:hypothetical protein
MHAHVFPGDKEVNDDLAWICECDRRNGHDDNYIKKMKVERAPLDKLGFQKNKKNNKKNKHKKIQFQKKRGMSRRFVICCIFKMSVGPTKSASSGWW